MDGARIGAWGGEIVEIWGEVVCAPSVKTPLGRFEGRRCEGFVRRAKSAQKRAHLLSAAAGDVHPRGGVLREIGVY